MISPKVKDLVAGDWIKFGLNEFGGVVYEASHGRSVSHLWGRVIGRDHDSVLIEPNPHVTKFPPYAFHKTLKDYRTNFKVSAEDIKRVGETANVCYIYDNAIHATLKKGGLEVGDRVVFGCMKNDSYPSTSRRPLAEGTKHEGIVRKFEHNSNETIPIVELSQGVNGNSPDSYGVDFGHPTNLYWGFGSHEDLMTGPFYDVLPGFEKDKVVEPPVKIAEAPVSPESVKAPEVTATATQSQVLKPGMFVEVEAQPPTFADGKYRIVDNANVFGKRDNIKVVVEIAAVNKNGSIYVFADSKTKRPNGAAYTFQGGEFTLYTYSPGCVLSNKLKTEPSREIWSLHDKTCFKVVPTPVVRPVACEGINVGDYVEVVVINESQIAYSAKQYADADKVTFVQIQVAAIRSDGKIYVFPEKNKQNLELTSNPISNYYESEKLVIEKHPMYGNPGFNKIWELSHTGYKKQIQISEGAMAAKKTAKPRIGALPTPDSEYHGFASPPYESTTMAAKKSIKDKLKKNLEDGTYLAASTRGIELFKSGIYASLEKRAPEKAMVAKMILSDPAAQPLLAMMFSLGLHYVPKYSDDPRVVKIADALGTKAVEGGANILMDILAEIVGPAAKAMIDSLPVVGTKKKVRISDPAPRRVAAKKPVIAVVPDDDGEEEEEKAASRQQRRTG